MCRNPDDGDPDVAPRYQCATHGYRADDWPCDRCESDIVQVFASELGPAESANELIKALERALSKVREREDEQKGRDLAARFEKGSVTCEP